MLRSIFRKLRTIFRPKGEPPPRVVLDTSVLVAALFNPRTARLLDQWRAGRLVWCACPDIMREYQRILLKIPPIRHQAKTLLAEYDRHRSNFWVETIPTLELAIADPSDSKFVACAVATKADYLLSLDDHLLSLHHTEVVRIIRPSQFLDPQENAVGGG